MFKKVLPCLPRDVHNMVTLCDYALSAVLGTAERAFFVMMIREVNQIAK